MQRLRILLLTLGLLSFAFVRPTSAGPESETGTPTRMISSVVPSATSVPSPSFSPTPLPASRIITRDDQGQTVRFAIGEMFILRLSGNTAWEIQITDPRVVVADRTRTPGPGEQGIYRARAAGVTELIAIAVPPCTRERPPCSVMAPAFRLLIVVR